MIGNSNTALARASALLLAFWLVALVFLTWPLSYSPNGEPSDDILKRLSRVVSELDSLKQQNQELRVIVSNITQSGLQINEEVVSNFKHKLKGLTMKGSKSNGQHSPSKQFELSRRQVDQGIQEMGFYLKSELEKLKKVLVEKGETSLTKKIGDIIQGQVEHERVLGFDLEEMSNQDGLDDWRAAEALALSHLVQKRLHWLQNPKDCSTARKLLCNLNKGCGYGCQIHHAAYCFILAYSTKRTLILQSKKWRYHRGGWEEIFMPLSETCLSSSGRNLKKWPGTNDTQVIELPIVDMLSPRPPHLPLAIPKDISERLMRLHGDPSVWWIGQFMKYLLRYQPDTQKFVDEAGANFGFQKPIVGIHVRRTDKVGTEAAFHSIEEYMVHVQEYYERLELKQGSKVEHRRVYLASDDASVLPEARKKYPNYTFLGDPSIASNAGVATRYSDSSLRGIIIDIHFLAHSDYLVCTFSSQVCRVAYEIMQTIHPDASSWFRSLDDIYYYGGQNAHKEVAIFPHTARNDAEISLEKGDVIGIMGNHWDGFSRGTNERTKKQGLYPSFKTKNKLEIVDFPSYLEADTQDS
uniref:Alpha-(1,6)-fucosyltransferase n=1 Tax=Lynceus sp. MCZ IZ 141354 TaxID=1930659 RepID=A0A9N6WUE8_9CRUS|nr:EOG090X03KK [Lynceus sp. MCZ IZ 141354]